MFRFLDHTADARVECRGEDFPALLTAAAQALYALAVRESGQSDTEQRSISLQVSTFDDGLVRWLQELIFLLDTERFVGAHFRFMSATADRIEATVGGYLCTPEARAEEVKSATYHDLVIEQDADGLVARFVLDL